MKRLYDFAIVGGGIVGLSTGMALTKRFPGKKIIVIEKESALAEHQTGHNSGVIHSGIYYKPGSFKAKFARAGSESMVRFCEEHAIEHEICGKVIVATKPEELPLLENLYKRGLENGLAIEKIGPDRLKEIEPHVAGLQAIRVPAAGIVNYKQVCQMYGRIITLGGGEISLGERVLAIRKNASNVEIETRQGVVQTKFVINCAGLHSDRVARMDNVADDLKIVPFRGEYYEIRPERRHLVKHLIYPVPNPNFPFLGVHYTRMIGGHVEAGPNAVLAFKREGYRKRDFSLRDLGEVLMYPGFWKLSSRYWREGLEEMQRSVSKAAFVKSLQQLIPEIHERDLVAAPAGVRAQALKADGSLVDDFHLIPGDRSIHVCNAPSPAATASIEIGEHIARAIGLAG
ncbi:MULTISPECIES: L-2-hydroxyglutarate oxidase [Burkholderia]|jgi:(S)-2-hydroxyglutarate dehydrogenase|uniref:L-2-hydroxyglutarate oxidase n=2 Tax=Burkholderia contaminans TaxID=488447 RepID=A0A1E3FHZ5_9BURK|nr:MULTISPECIES: L-2-hydroxyglutarate oxidase [Burkholderia]UTP24281.1 L-2-hydroxyglutarate oxidase [Burkholderia sp. FXe9]KKL31861.1 hydroxyglutarate oxidase [Burkholderia contaminans LMG 23361]MBA9830131.1 L-2-hydroxyglutarate oxidase [Burkholderia contaminans]MBA9839672.1 L-2-hydroxyglutarate oxidase [Burkholderia contaminans]MBA9862744.1 L-2-hydroxyglutarate oxidase [Burkholderia contaminans]